MSTCIKTGGLIVLEDYWHAFSCDLHMIRKGPREAVAIVAYTVGAPVLDWPAPIVSITVRSRADYFYREPIATSPGVVVVSPAFCNPSTELVHYLADDPFAQLIRWAQP